MQKSLALTHLFFPWPNKISISNEGTIKLVRDPSILNFNTVAYEGECGS